MAERKRAIPQKTANVRTVRKSPISRKPTSRNRFRDNPFPRKTLKQRLFGILITLFVLGLAAAGAAGILAYQYFAKGLPPVDSLHEYHPPSTTTFYSDDGRIIGEYFKQRRTVVPLSQIPKHVQLAFIAAEDDGFYHHPGVDFKAVLRAAIENLKHGYVKEGASTITMQVAREFFLTKERSYVRKVKETIMAHRIDSTLTKDEVLHLYLNQIYLGESAYGVEAAAQVYYNKHVEQLTLAEAAVLAGLPKAPSENNPFKNPKRANERKEYCLRRMVDNQFITQEQMDRAMNQELVYAEHENPNRTITPYFTEHVRRILADKFGEDDLYRSGYKIYTTVNIEMQEAARQALRRGLAELTKRHKYRGPLQQLTEDQARKLLAEQTQTLESEPLAPGRQVQVVVTKVNAKAKTLTIRYGNVEGEIKAKGLEWILITDKNIGKLVAPGDVVLAACQEQDQKTGKWLFTLEQESLAQGALLSMDTETGAVKAMVGGLDFNKNQFNRAIQAKRQPGSSFKAILYTAAIEKGFTPGSILIDAPIVYDDYAHNRRWKPTNFDRKFYGPTTLYTGLTTSRNVMAIKLLNLIGYDPVIELAHKMGINSPLEENLSLALGSSVVTLSEMVTAFSIFPNLGERVDPMYITRIENQDGRVIEEFHSQRTRVVSPETASVVQFMLRGVVSHGTGSVVNALERPAGGKTGTTNDAYDAWFLGFTPELVTGVWVGRDELQKLGYNEGGGRAAAPIFLYYMQEALKDKPVREFEVPEDVIVVDNGTTGIAYKKGTFGKDYREEDPAAAANGTGGQFTQSQQNEKEL